MAKVLKLLLLLFLILSLSATVYYASRVVSYTSKATYTNSNISTENSYVFASPVAARADGQENIRITIFILNAQGLGIANLPVEIQTNRPSTKIIPISPTTDETGKSYFELSTTSTGPVTIIAKSQDKELPQRLTINFY